MMGKSGVGVGVEGIMERSGMSGSGRDNGKKRDEWEWEGMMGRRGMSGSRRDDGKERGWGGIGRDDGKERDEWE